MKASGISIGVVILAAGASTRMGRPKLLLPWGGTSILGHIANQWRALNATQVVPVVRRDDSELEREWMRLGNLSDSRIVNEQAETGMFSSVRAASRWDRWDSNITHFVVTLGDQPQVSRETLRSLLQNVSQSAFFIWQPRVKGRPKHPVVFPREIFLNMGSSEASTLRDFLEHRQVKRRYMDCDDPGLDFDLDTPEDYANALRRFASGLAEVV